MANNSARVPVVRNSRKTDSRGNEDSQFAGLPSTFYRRVLPCRSWPGDTNTSPATVRDQMYIHACRISIKYTGRADIVGQYRPGSQVQQPILGCALKPRPLFRGCINHISLSAFKSTPRILKLFPTAREGKGREGVGDRGWRGAKG